MEPKTLLRELEGCAALLRERRPWAPAACFFGGSGLGSVSALMEERAVLPYSALPSFPKTAAFSQENALAVGRVAGTETIAFDGRLHAYDGHSPAEIAFPVRLAHLLGARVFVASNLAGALNPAFKKGDLVRVDDHLNLMGMSPLAGPHEPWMGERYPDMSAPYDAGLTVWAHQAAVEAGLELKKGVYAAVLGPQLETRAEYRFLRAAGADLVGMSTVPEVIVARQLGMKVLVISVVSDECRPEDLRPIDLADVLEAARRAQAPLNGIFRRVLARLTRPEEAA